MEQYVLDHVMVYGQGCVSDWSLVNNSLALASPGWRSGTVAQISKLA